MHTVILQVNWIIVGEWCNGQKICRDKFSISLDQILHFQLSVVWVERSWQGFFQSSQEWNLDVFFPNFEKIPIFIIVFFEDWVFNSVNTQATW